MDGQEKLVERLNEYEDGPRDEALFRNEDIGYTQTSYGQEEIFKGFMGLLGFMADQMMSR
ncbi:hypothetical protein HYALB_00006682 [Hymenoscyphus albidus]|uniref:Uncharacterized protein n=1 Tax=Hymenoscyphus albidus TaxID=595503 RepID=A0A9N9LGS5_9HELO|nr:hypothetical protein HYALB_00006682 [Hymenoscyphus albidus]